MQKISIRSVSKTLFLFTLCLATATAANAQLWTYSYPESIVNSNESEVRRSSIYNVVVRQGSTSETCYVMYDRNQFRTTGNNNVKKNPDNHWTNFSVTGAVDIEITRVDGGNISEATIYPLKKGYTAIVSNNKAIISLPAGANKLQLWVDIPGLEEQPLFVFIDPEETDVPNPGSSSVTMINTTDNINTVIAKLNGTAPYAYFEPGIHKWGNIIDENYSGYKLPIASNKKIYIPGGAYVIGSFNSEDTDNWQVYGRGIISGAGLDILPSATYIPWSAVHATSGSSNTRVEGIVSMCPPHFALTIRGDVDIDNVKMMSWWHSTDGTITGDNSTVNNCFFKVMDDAIKVYGNNSTHDNITIYHQVNGAALQFSWSGQNGDDNTVTNLYVVNSIYKSLGETSNTAIVNVVEHNSGQVTQNNTINGVYIDNGCHMLLGMNPSNGTYRNFTIKNIELNQGKNATPQHSNSYLSGGGNFSNFRITNLKINGHYILETNNTKDDAENGQWWFKGATHAVQIDTVTEMEIPIEVITSAKIESEIGFYPNPVKDELYLTNGLKPGQFVRIIDMTGKEMMITLEQPVHVSLLRRGFYILIFENQQLKFFKE